MTTTTMKQRVVEWRMSRAPLPLHAFALVIVRKDDRFLMVQERKDEQGWYFPAGRMDPGETIAQAAVRETREEAGVDVELTGLYRIEQRPGPPVRLRVFFAAEARGDTTPKRHADEHSLQAAWLTIAELRERTLRGDEVLDVLEAVEAGAPVHSIALLVEGDWRPWRA